MAYPAFTLYVPADPGYRTIGAEVVAKYVDLVGGSEAQRTAFEMALLSTVNDLAVSGGGDVELLCMADPPGFHVIVKCGSRSAMIRHPVPVEKR